MSFEERAAAMGFRKQVLYYYYCYCNFYYFHYYDYNDYDVYSDNYFHYDTAN